MRRLRKTLSAIALGASLAFAAAQPGKAAEADAGKGDAPVAIEVPAFFAPMTIDNRLDSYAYITVLLTPSAPENALPIRAKMAFLRDAFLRELNKGTIVKADNPKEVDTAAIKTRLIDRMNKILAPGTVADFKFEPIVYTAVQPQS